MEPVLTPEEMRAVDEATISGGVPGFDLMDRASAAGAAVGLRMLGGGYGRRVVVAAGKGNNGGDGIACARHLARAGVHVRTFLLGEPSGDPAEHLALARRGPGAVFEEWSPGRFSEALRHADLAVDAVFGTGFSGEPRGGPGEAIAALADPPCPTLAVDIASGVSGADGSVPGTATRAEVTLAIQALKAGHVAPPGAFRCGRVDVADIGIGVSAARTFVPRGPDVAEALPVPAPDTHKYRTGVLACLAGSPGMTGAAILLVRGALRTGAGLVICGVPRSSLEVLETSVTEAVKVPLPDEEGRLGPKAVDELSDRLERAGALAVGPGIGRGPGTVELLRRVCELDLPVVCDADGLWAVAELLAEDPGILRHRSQPTVLTPHLGELSRLLGRSVGEDRLREARDAAASWGAVVHLKGRRAVTASPDGRVWVNPTGNPGMASGGTGDVLTGVVGTLLAQGLDARDATWAGAYLHGLAGDVAAARRGRRPLVAGDVAEALSIALDRLGPDRSRGPVRTVFEHPREA